MAQQIPIFTVDAFSPGPFGGNPAAVCLLEEDISDELKQKMALEMNLSETAFVTPLSVEADPFKNGKNFSLRWFTPTTEVPLCGHATLASATILFYEMGNQNAIEFVTRQSGILSAKKSSSVQNGVEMVLPINPPEMNLDDPNSSAQIWKLVNTITDNNPGLNVKNVRLSEKTKKLLIRLQDDVTMAQLEGMKVDKEALLKIDTLDQVRGVIITVDGKKESGGKYDFVSRYFAPWVGIPEDPVTGSAHTVLTTYWSKEKSGAKHFFAKQCSSRGGELTLMIRGEDELVVCGQGTIVLRGSFLIS